MADTVLTFVTSLRHPDTTDDYAGVEHLLGQTLRSLDAQLDRRFEVVVVANRPYSPPPGLGFAVTTATVGFAAPPREFATKDDKHAAIKLDKGLKLAVAMTRSRATHAMCLDSDDFVSRRLVGFVADHGGDAPGWFVDRGVRYDVVTGLFRPQRHFNDVCGTSLVWRRDLMPDADLGPDPAADDVLAAFGHDRVVEELGSHRTLRRRYGFAAVPFPAAVYAVNHGQNHSGSGAPMLGVPLGRRRAAEFGIDVPDPAATRRAAVAQLRPAHLRRVVATVTRRAG
ncbi:hypothetical protein SAMN05443575_1921 [Jatrophihabitans endophyticus]|uniref:Glycosyl transferase family 2 n=1 Tax=Jatrophihabitans endophyticus TaxID=1206085 RepID=A0A1M5IK62_9ACTN|nr:hypothetical protein [Jatrophihabitans endophyticus]SHG28667.1 hypothetical protein SAMN05443575_1921 [Jatrophihabitans endophyticus]